MEERSPEDTAALLAVQRLQTAYADAVTRRAWEDVRALFDPGAVVDIDTRSPDRTPIHLDGPDAIAGFIGSAVEKFAFFEVAILNAVADIDDRPPDASSPDDRGADGRVYVSEHRLDHDARWSQAFGLYQDRYRRHNGRWSIARRRYTSLARRGERTEFFDLPQIDVWPHWPR